MTNEPILISKKATAHLLGVSVSMVSLLIAKKKLTAVRIGRRVLIRRQDVECLALTRRQRAALDLGSESVQ